MTKHVAMSADGLVLRDQLRAGIVRVGWSKMARRSGINRSSLHRAFKPGGAMPNFTTVTAVAAALGKTLTLCDSGAKS